MTHTYPSAMINSKVYKVTLGEQKYHVFAGCPKKAIEYAQYIRKVNGLRVHRKSEYKVEEINNE